ncbi:CASP C terminal-domain-containing protein [Dipodascopsis tothii]|uniref:CASP C terminal-domain-containing protein n=1 Tax=Dipodascopsis tothii TaxID=44089 RepID=UPI0034CE91B7
MDEDAPAEPAGTDAETTADGAPTDEDVTEAVAVPAAAAEDPIDEAATTTETALDEPAEPEEAAPAAEAAEAPAVEPAEVAPTVATAEVAPAPLAAAVRPSTPPPSSPALSSFSPAPSPGRPQSTAHSRRGSEDASVLSKTPFEQALQVWSNIGFSNLQRELDTQTEEIFETQKLSMVSRKDLASKTKEFRRLGDEEKLVEIKSLLKAYQTEIDNLTKRGKFAETAFLNVYRALGEAPDPYPLLEATLDAMAKSEEVGRLTAEVGKLRRELRRYEDYDELGRKLRVAEQRVIDVAAQRVADKEAELKALMDEKERGWKLKEDDYVRQSTDMRETIRELRANHEVAQAQLTQHEQKLGDGVAGRLAEAEILAADLERINFRALQTERRNLELRQELERAKAETRGEAVQISEEAQRRLDDLIAENTALGRKLDALRDDARDSKAAHKKRLATLERENKLRADEVEALKARLRRVDDYDEIKRELDILKYVEFSTGLDDDDEPRPTNGQPESLEQLLLARNKKLSGEVTTLRVEHERALAQAADLSAKLHSTEVALNQSRKLTVKLEDDLVSFHDAGAATMSLKSYNPSRVNTSPPSLNTPTHSVFGGRRDDAMSVSSLTVPGSDPSILPIITQQRDRFRARNAELEEELRKEFNTITGLRGEIEALQRDNLALYEKTRYISTYRQPTPRALPPPAVAGEDRYRSEYEENISPFAQFRGREQERAMSRMGPLERVIYGLTRVVLSNKYSRNMFFVYLTCLHVFVMGVIWYLAMGELTEADAARDVPGAGLGGAAAFEAPAAAAAAAAAAAPAAAAGAPVGGAVLR